MPDLSDEYLDALERETDQLRDRVRRADNDGTVYVHLTFREAGKIATALPALIAEIRRRRQG